MNRFTKNIACGLLVVSLGATGLSGCAAKPLDGTKTVATFEGQEIPLGVATFLLRYTQAQMETYYGAMLGGNMWGDTGTNENFGETTKQDVLNQLEEMMLLKERAGDYSISISDEENAKIEETAKAFIDANSEETLKAMAVTESHVVTALELYTYQSKLFDPITVDVNTEVADEEAAQSKITYAKFSTAPVKGEDGKETELSDEEKAAKKDQAQTLLDKLKTAEDPSAADVDALAKEIDEKLTAADGVTYGSDDTTLDDAVKTAVTSLEDGSVAQQIIEGEDAYYVIRLDKKFDEDATNKKKESIVDERKKEVYQETIDGWKKDAKFSVESSVWKKVTITNNESFTFKQQEAPSQTPADEETPTDESADSPSTPAEAQEGDTGSASDNITVQ